jgi:hypothetical protein
MFLTPLQDVKGELSLKIWCKKKKKKNFKRPNNDYSKISSAKSMRG